MLQNDVLLPGIQTEQGLGVFQSYLGVLGAMSFSVGSPLAGPVVEVEVMEESAPGGGAGVQSQGQAEAPAPIGDQR